MNGVKQPHWNGTRWVEPGEDINAVVIAGFVFAVLMPLVGFVIGVTQINRNKYGLRIMIGSIGGAMLWASLYGG